jgi:hypothetical protein
VPSSVFSISLPSSASAAITATQEDRRGDEVYGKPDIGAERESPGESPPAAVGKGRSGAGGGATRSTMGVACGGEGGVVCGGEDDQQRRGGGERRGRRGFILWGSRRANEDQLPRPLIFFAPKVIEFATITLKHLDPNRRRRLYIITVST